MAKAQKRAEVKAKLTALREDCLLYACEGRARAVGEKLSFMSLGLQSIAENNDSISNQQVSFLDAMLVELRNYALELFAGPVPVQVLKQQERMVKYGVPTDFASRTMNNAVFAFDASEYSENSEDS